MCVYVCVCVCVCACVCVCQIAHILRLDVMVTSPCPLNMFTSSDSQLLPLLCLQLFIFLFFFVVCRNIIIETKPTDDLNSPSNLYVLVSEDS